MPFPRYELMIKSRRSFTRPDDVLATVRLHCAMLPEYMPMKWGWFEPLKQVFDPAQPEQLLENGIASNVWWKRTGARKADGSWRRCWPKPSSPSRTHASIDLSVYETRHQDKLLAYLKAASQQSEADIGFIESISERYVDFAMESNLTEWANKQYPSSWHILLGTHELRHWLPDMPWVVVFGPAYVRMFGKERLLSTPAFRVEDIGSEMVFIQLTPKMEDIHEQYDVVMAARAEAKRHLGEDAFFKPELAYDYKEPENKDKAGKVFRVPVFDLPPE
jgi:hypothetical protein